MKNLEQQFSEDLLIEKSPNSVRLYSDPIPVDLLVDIFSRVPAESIARFHCVSKLWRSILRRRHDFTELFMARSITRPRLLFTFKVEDKLFIFSSTQPQNLDGDNCSLVATRYKDFPKHFPTGTVDHLSSGLVCLPGTGIGRRVPIVCNPITGEFIDLAKGKAVGTKKSYVGYDPINKQFKVLFLTSYGSHNHVETLGTRKQRSTIECERHTDQYGEICINGVLYYGAYLQESKSRVIVCFDFRFEKFSFIEIDHEMYNVYELYSVSLFNYKGKLGAYKFNHRWAKMVFWVLDAEKHKWSKSKCVLSHLYNEKIGHNCYVVGITSASDIVFKPVGEVNPTFHLFFYNMERHTCTRVDIQGLDEFKYHNFNITTYLDYVENIMPF